MKNEPCPPEAELSAFVRCRVSEDQAESISEHVSNCPQCEETVVGLEKDADTVFDGLKKIPATFPFQHEPELERMAQAAKQQSPDQMDDESNPLPPVVMLEYLRDYQILEKIGEGGMGAVYKAVHQRLKKTVALKILAPNRIGDQPTVDRFEREMSVIGQLNHPHIVQALDAGEHDGRHYLVMEFVEGSDLSDIVKRCSPLSIADACQLISQAAGGLQYAHENGFVHRDIKPSNLMLATAGQRAAQSQAVVKILDLGLARALDQQAGAAKAKADLTTTGQVMGTLDYMAPEQGGDAHQVDIRADIYSLGATLYKLLTGDSPYAEHSQKPPLQRLMAIAQHEPPAIRSKRAAVPEKLAVIVHRMLAKKPENRFATPAEVVEALVPFCTGADLAALLIPQGAARTPATRSPVTMPARQSASGRGISRRWKTALAGFGGFCFLAAILLITTRNGTVEVTSPDGKLPDDVKVVVSHGGDEIELLQADNQWSAKIVNGEYQVQLRGGEDRFEIKDSKLTVSRMGRIAVTVDLRKPVPDFEKPVATTTSPGEQPRTMPAVAQSHLPLSTERWALRFVHVEDRVEVPPLPIDWTQPFTIEVWAERDPNTTTHGGGGAWNVVNLSDSCGLAFFRASMGWQIQFSQQLSVGESAKWNTTGSRAHVAAQWTGEEMQLFVNGKCEYLPPWTGLEPGTDAKTWIVQCLAKANGLPIQLGQLQFDAEPDSNGNALDGVRISRGVRYTDRFVPTELGADDKTVALYRFDEGSGDALKDSSGNGHHGKIRTAKWVRITADVGMSRVAPLDVSPAK